MSDNYDDDDQSVIKIEDLEDDTKSNYSSFSNMLRRRNNANEDDGEDEDFQRIEDDQMNEED